MGVAAHSPPNFEAAHRAFGTPQGPVETHAFEPLALNNKVNGIMNMVFAYGGAMIFPEMVNQSLTQLQQNLNSHMHQDGRNEAPDGLLERNAHIV
ncbi:hypothetical protein C0989_011555 [Termitomyces sp. Mn162]|nr:hypothetical protein C0989_011555 [Termitomyces sp. Mn162]